MDLFRNNIVIQFLIFKMLHDSFYLLWNWDETKFPKEIIMSYDGRMIKGSDYKSAIGNKAFFSGIHEWKLSDLNNAFAGITIS